MNGMKVAFAQSPTHGEVPELDERSGEERTKVAEEPSATPGTSTSHLRDGAAAAAPLPQKLKFRRRRRERLVVLQGHHVIGVICISEFDEAHDHERQEEPHDHLEVVE